VHYRLKKSEILSGSGNFRLIFKHGRKIKGEFLNCFVLADSGLRFCDGSDVKVGFVVSRDVKRAVDRNRIRRIIKESYRLSKPILTSKVENISKPLGIVFLFSSDITGEVTRLSFSDIEHDMKKLLSFICETVIE
jgi:ribonuclease P protein component